MKKAVIFDMDGVLVFTEEFYFNRRMSFFDELEIEPPTRKIQDFIGLSSAMIWEMLVPEDEKKRESLREKYLEYSKEHEINFKEVLNTSTKEVMMKLRGKNLKIAIASSSGKQDILRMVKECEFEEYIDFTISGEECEKSKPSPEIYFKAIKALKLQAEDVLVVEDSTLGIRAAKAAGVNVVALVPEDYYMDQSEADYKINDLIQIVNQLRSKS